MSQDAQRSWGRNNGRSWRAARAPLKSLLAFLWEAPAAKAGRANSAHRPGPSRSNLSTRFERTATEASSRSDKLVEPTRKPSGGLVGPPETRQQIQKPDRVPSSEPSRALSNAGRRFRPAPPSRSESVR